MISNALLRRKQSQKKHHANSQLQPRPSTSTRPLRPTRSLAPTRRSPPHSDSDGDEHINDDSDEWDPHSKFSNDSDSDSADEFEASAMISRRSLEINEDIANEMGFNEANDEARAPQNFKTLDHEGKPFEKTPQSRLSEYIRTPLDDTPTPIDVFRLLDSTTLATLRSNGPKTSGSLYTTC